MRNDQGSATAWVLGLTALGIVCLVVYIGFGSGYNSRRHIANAIEDAGRLKADVAAFRLKNNRWPDAREAAQMPGAKKQYYDVRAIGYDAEKKAVVITMDKLPYEGKRFGFFAEDRDGKLEWACRRIDIDTKYLPAGCRN